MLDEAKVKAVFGAIVAQLQRPTDFVSAKDFYAAGLSAGLDMTGGEPERRAATLGAMMKSFATLSTPEQTRALTSVTRTLMNSGIANAIDGARILADFGLAWDENDIVTGGMDDRERHFLPATSAADLNKAFSRLSSGDESGAISAACGAVDLATTGAYERMGLGDPGKVSFSAKVNTALQHMKVFEGMRAEFCGVGMDEADAEEATRFLEKAINDSSQALQILRKRMGDVHGTRPALKSTAYDCIKFASAICALFQR